MLTKEEWLSKVLERDQDTNYDYSKFEYKGTFIKSTIICPEHGEFLMNPNNRLNGQQCSKCRKENCRVKEREQKFRETIKNRYSNSFDFSEFVFKDHQTKGKIICPIHGSFEVAPKHLVKGVCCKKCKSEEKSKKLKEQKYKEKTLNKKPRIPYNKKSTEDWKKEFFRLHKDKYTYLDEQIDGSRFPLKIICPTHGSFIQKVSEHIRGYGCKKCSSLLSNFSKSQWIKKAKDRTGIFYILKMYNEEECFYKIGITFLSIKNRYYNCPYEYEIVESIEDKDLSYIWNLEKINKKLGVPYAYMPKIYFGGCASECFSEISFIESTCRR